MYDILKNYVFIQKLLHTATQKVEIGKQICENIEAFCFLYGKASSKPKKNFKVSKNLKKYTQKNVINFCVFFFGIAFYTLGQKKVNSILYLTV